MYHQPLESRSVAISNDSEEYKAYKQYVDNAKTQDEESQRKSSCLYKKQTKVLNRDLKVLSSVLMKLTYCIILEVLRRKLKNLNRISRILLISHLDESGLVKNAAEYHKALSAAMNPDKFASFFTNKVMAAATEDVTRKIKNINMSTRSAPEVTSKGGTQFRAMNPSTGKGLKIRSIKNKN